MSCSEMITVRNYNSLLCMCTCVNANKLLFALYITTYEYYIEITYTHMYRFPFISLNLLMQTNLIFNERNGTNFCSQQNDELYAKWFLKIQLTGTIFSIAN